MASNCFLKLIPLTSLVSILLLLLGINYIFEPVLRIYFYKLFYNKKAETRSSGE